MKNTMEIAGALVRRRRGVLLSSARAVANPRRGHSVAAIRVAPSTGAEIGCGGAGASDLPPRAVPHPMLVPAPVEGREGRASSGTRATA